MSPKRQGLKSLASTGARGYPLEAAATIAVDAVRSASTKVRTIRFVCFDRQTLRAFQSAIEAGSGGLRTALQAA